MSFCFQKSERWLGLWVVGWSLKKSENKVALNNRFLGQKELAIAVLNDWQKAAN